jgi:hypothetical protein
MARMRLIAFALFAIVSAWATAQRAFAYHTGYGYLSGADCTNGGLWGFSHHAHNCSYGAGYLYACLQWCQLQGAQPDSATCSNNDDGTTSGLCLCKVAFCCSANGCASGHGGWQWSPENCAIPYEDEGDGCYCCYSSTPLIVSLRGDKITLSSANDGVMFDFFGDGKLRLYAWPTDGSDAWLVLDRNHNGLVDDGSELFGNAALLKSGEHAKNGYEVLAELDENHDGIVDARDPRFGDIKLWRDFIRNGRVDPGELVSASQAGIISFDTRYEESRHKDKWGNAFRYRALTTYNHSPLRRFSYDVFITSAEPPSSH